MSSYFRKTCFLLCAFCLVALSACTATGSKSIAVLDVGTILSSGAHAEKAKLEVNKAQEIYQYNLNVIVKELEKYKNKEQAKAYLTSASQQLQAQLNASRNAVTQELTNALYAIIADEKANYEVIFFKNSTIYANESLDITAKVQKKYNEKTITYPQLPKRVNKPNLPADAK